MATSADKLFGAVQSLRALQARLDAATALSASLVAGNPVQITDGNTRLDVPPAQGSTMLGNLITNLAAQVSALQTKIDAAAQQV